MPKFRVEMTRRVNQTQYVTVEVAAENEELAREEALEAAWDAPWKVGKTHDSDGTDIEGIERIAD